jgi:hypothetical protein
MSIITAMIRCNNMFFMGSTLKFEVSKVLFRSTIYIIIIMKQLNVNTI